MTFRPLYESDRYLINKWINEDPGHAGKMTADFFLNPNDEDYPTSCYAACDEEGPAMFIRQESIGHSCRMHIQFGMDKKRVVKVFREGYPLVAADAKKRGFKEIIFDSCSPALVRWMSEFGFVFVGSAVL